ncbi:hypothetical protein L4D06_20905 [Enterovibrio makurazakiensis]|uniref:hypothetical protein n=1 Tax=Enterovibrio makurazakiensis TaxID=2910232 RepID=UPI003D236919
MRIQEEKKRKEKKRKEKKRKEKDWLEWQNRGNKKRRKKNGHDFRRALEVLLAAILLRMCSLHHSMISG